MCAETTTYDTDLEHLTGSPPGPMDGPTLAQIRLKGAVTAMDRWFEVDPDTPEDTYYYDLAERLTTKALEALKGA